MSGQLVGWKTGWVLGLRWWWSYNNGMPMTTGEQQRSVLGPVLLYSFIECILVTFTGDSKLRGSLDELESRAAIRRDPGGQWIMVRGTPWNSTRTNTKCCPWEGRAFGLTWAEAGGAGEQLCGKVPGVVMGSKLNMNMNSPLCCREYAEPLPNT